MWINVVFVGIALILNTFGTEIEKPKGKVLIAGLFPMSENVAEGSIGRGVTPAVDLALKMINKDPDILPDHKLDILANDTQCDMAVATKFFFDIVDSNNTLVMVFGDACSIVSGPIAEISKEWDVCLLSYADTDPILSDRKKYSNFYRTVPSESDFNPARLSLLRKFNWTHVGTIFQGVSKGTARYGQAHNHLISVLEKSSINVIKSVGFVNDPELAILELKKLDARIIIGNFDENMARHVFCHAYKNGMYGPKYQWIILGGYKKDWWNVSDDKLECSSVELNKTVFGYISTDVLPLSSNLRKKTVSGLTSREYNKTYTQHSKGEYSKYHAYAFDGVWVIAKVVHAILKKTKERSNTTIVYDDMFRGDNIVSALNDTNFRGVTGQIRFKGGDRVGSILFEQYQGEKMIKVGEYHAINDRLSFKRSEPIIWQGKGPPIDRKLISIEFQRVPKIVYIIFCAISGLGIIMSIFFLVTNIIFREHRYIKMSSPNLNNIITVGCMLTYFSVFLLGTDGGVVKIVYLSHICISRAWVLSLGFTLAFGAMFSKTWRVHSIFKEVALHKKVIKDYKLFLLVSVLVIVDSILLITWQILDPLQTSTKIITTFIEGDLNIIRVVEYCKSIRMSIWLGLIYAYKGLLLVFGCFLAWETRFVSIPALNDSKYIGMSVYNVVIMCVCGAAVSFVINDQPTSSFVIISFFIVFCTTITLCLVFVPKLIELRRDPTGEERRIRAKLQKPKKQTSREEMNDDLHRRNNELQQENIKYRNVIAEKMRILSNIMVQLGDDNINDEIHYAGKSPIHKKVVELRLTDSPSKLSTVSSSDVDDGSIYTEISGGSPSWIFGNNPASRIRLEAKQSVTSMCTESSIADSCDESRRVSQCKHTTSEMIETDEDDVDAFGGVYCGPPKTPAQKLKASKENGRSRTVTEVHPLVHDFQHKSYRTADTDLFKSFQNRDGITNIKVQHAGRKPPIIANKAANLEIKKNRMLGRRQRMRKIAFMIPNKDKMLNKCLIASLNSAKCETDSSQNKQTNDKGNKGELSCDIIEHI